MKKAVLRKFAILTGKHQSWNFFSTLSVPVPDKVKKIKLNFYFHTSFWCLKKFYEGLKGLHKTFRGTTKKCENKNLT